MAKNLNGLCMIDEICAPESDTLCIEGMIIIQSKRIAEVIAPSKIIDNTFFLVPLNFSFGIANKRRHKGAYTTLLSEIRIHRARSKDNCFLDIFSLAT